MPRIHGLINASSRAYGFKSTSLSLINGPLVYTLNTTPPTQLYSLTTDGSLMVYSYSPSTSYIYRASSPYTSWSSVTTAGPYRYSVKYLGGVYLNFGGSNDGSINRSTDAVNWSSCAIGGNGGSTSSYMVYNATRNEWVAGCGSWVATNCVRKSTDATNFGISYTYPSGTSGDTAIATSGLNNASAYMFAMTTSSSSVMLSVARSQDASSWTESNWISLNGSSRVRFLEYFNGRYWLCNDNNVLGTTTDGLTWTNVSYTNLDFQMRGAGSFIIGGTICYYISGDNALALSLDGINWVKKTHSFSTLSNFISISGSVYCIDSNKIIGITF
jgi:hypothetical protein